MPSNQTAQGDCTKRQTCDEAEDEHVHINNFFSTFPTLLIAKE